MRPSVRLKFLGIGTVLVVALTVLGFYLFRPDRVCRWSTKGEREATLRMELITMRMAIDNYILDKQEPPKSIQDLANTPYLKRIPIDPFTCKRDWALLIEEVELSSDQKATGIVDVHSSSDQRGSNGEEYGTW